MQNPLQRPLLSTIGEIEAAYAQQTQDALLAQQQAVALQLQQAQAAMAAQMAAPAAAAPAAPVVPTAPTQQPAAAPQSANPWAQWQQSKFATEFLPKNKQSLQDFAALPFEDRQKLLDDFVKERAGTDEAKAAQMREAGKALVYADAGGAEPDSGVVRGAADVATSVASGVVRIGEALTNVTGAGNAVSDSLGNFADWLNSTKSDASKAERANIARRIEQAKKEGTTTAEIAAYLNAFGDQPLEMLAEGIGSLATLAVSRGKSALKRKDVLRKGGTKEAADAAARRTEINTNMALGGATGVGIVKGAQYDTAYAEAKASGKTDTEAEAIADQAQTYFNANNLGQQAIGGGLGALAGRFGIENMLAKPVTNRVGAAVVAGGSEFATEALQGGQEAFAGNLAAINQGVMDPSRLMEGVAGSAVLEGVVGGTLGTSLGLARSPDMPAYTPQADGTIVGAPPGTPVAPAAPGVVDPAAAVAPEPMPVAVPIPTGFISPEEAVMYADTTGMDPDQIDALAAQIEIAMGVSNNPEVSKEELEAAVPGLKLRPLVVNPISGMPVPENDVKSAVQAQAMAEQAMADKPPAEPTLTQAEQTVITEEATSAASSPEASDARADRGEPPLVPGLVRLYSTGTPGKFDGDADLSPSREFVEGLALPDAELQYVDVPAEIATQFVGGEASATLSSAITGARRPLISSAPVDTTSSVRTRQQAALAAFSPMVGTDASPPPPAGKPKRQRRPEPTLEEMGLSQDPSDKVRAQQERERKVQEAEVDQADAAETVAKGRVTDFMRAAYMDDPKGTERGSARLVDPSRDIWQARFLRDDGTSVDVMIRGTERTREFLSRFVHQKENGDYVRSRVVAESKDSGHKGLYTHVTNQLDALTPGIRSVTEKLIAVGISPDRAFGWAKGWAGLKRVFSSRASALEALSPEARDRFLNQRSAGRAEVLSGGFGKRSFADYADGMQAQFDAIRNLGVAAHAIEDYMYAASAAQSNALRMRVLPVDSRGRPNPNKGDFAKFSYSVYSDGTIAEWGAPGSTVVEGKDATEKYKAAFAQQYPGLEATMASYLANLKESNEYVLALQLANGVIGPSEFAQLKAQGFYLPMQQARKGRASGIINRATGRSTRAMSPLAQWRPTMEARIEYAHYKGAVQQIVQDLLERPNPVIGVVNASDVKAKPLPDIDENGEVVNPSVLAAVDWDSSNSTSVWVGDKKVRVTFTDPTVSAALNPSSPSYAAAMQVAANANRLWASSLVSTPAFWLKSATWDLVLPFFTIQGAFGIKNSERMAVPPLESLKVTAKTYGKLIGGVAGVAFGQGALATAAKRSWQDARGQSFVSADPMRQLYNANGGGVMLGAVTALDTSQNVLRGAAGRGAHLGKKGMDIAHMPGHVLSDAVRFAAFSAYLETQNGGKFRSVAELQSFAQANPEVIKKAVLGSKRVLGNYEDVGQNIVAKSVIPFFNAATIGATQTLPIVLSSQQGRAGGAMLAAVAFITAMAGMDDDDDKDRDGHSNYLRQAASWDGIRVGDAVAQVPHELRLFIAAGNLAAIAATDAKVDKTAAYSHFWRTVRGAMLPIPGVESGAEGRAFASDLGLLGQIGMIAVSNEDQYGRAWASNAAKRNDKGNQPFYMNPRSGDTADATWLSEQLFRMGMNVEPARLDALINTLPIPGYGAGYGSMRKELELGAVDGRGQEQALIDWLTGAFMVKDNKFASRDRWQEESKGMLGQSETTAQAFAKYNDVVNDLVSGMGILHDEAGHARRSGDTRLYQAKMKHAENKALSSDVLRKRWYESTGNANRNLLD